MGEITLQEVLCARDLRAASQRRLLAAYGLPLLGFTMNIAGPVKRSRLGDFAFREGLEALRRQLGGRVLHQEVTDRRTGLEALLVCSLPAEELKALAMDLESGSPAGRLCDMDVIAPDGGKLSRPAPRTCLVCGGPAAPCARSRAHGLPAVQEAAQALLEDFAAQRLAELAVQALLEEVDQTPKPGLVDRNNRGSHQDMDRDLFHRSARSLLPYFRRAVTLGLERADCMGSLQKAGLAAERVMLAETGGVNTHRGAVYAFGLILAAMGSRLARGGDVFAGAAALAESGLPPAAGSHGQRARQRYGAPGARGEALAGFPHARQAWAALARPGGRDAALLTLLAEVEDTNLLHRGGPEGLALVQSRARSILAASPPAYGEGLLDLDRACIARNLSPGGSADLLALALFLGRTEAVWLDGAPAGKRL